MQHNIAATLLNYYGATVATVSTVQVNQYILFTGVAIFPEVGRTYVSRPLYVRSGHQATKQPVNTDTAQVAAISSA